MSERKKSDSRGKNKKEAVKAAFAEVSLKKEARKVSSPISESYGSYGGSIPLHTTALEEQTSSSLDATTAFIEGDKGSFDFFLNEHMDGHLAAIQKMVDQLNFVAEINQPAIARSNYIYLYNFLSAVYALNGSFEHFLQDHPVSRSEEPNFRNAYIMKVSPRLQQWLNYIRTGLLYKKILQRNRFVRKMVDLPIGAAGYQFFIKNRPSLDMKSFETLWDEQTSSLEERSLETLWDELNAYLQNVGSCMSFPLEKQDALDERLKQQGVYLDFLKGFFMHLQIEYL